MTLSLLILFIYFSWVALKHCHTIYIYLYLFICLLLCVCMWNKPHKPEVYCDILWTSVSFCWQIHKCLLPFTWFLSSIICSLFFCFPLRAHSCTFIMYFFAAGSVEKSASMGRGVDSLSWFPCFQWSQLPWGMVWMLLSTELFESLLR